MKAFLYISRAVNSFDSCNLIELANRAHDFNQAHGISGFLYFHDNCFLQYIEGEEESLTSLFERIKADPRHQMLTCITDDVKAPRFPNWGMKLLSDGDIFKVPLDYFLFNFFNHYQEEKTEQWQQKIWPIVDKISLKSDWQYS